MEVQLYVLLHVSDHDLLNVITESNTLAKIFKGANDIFL